MKGLVLFVGGSDPSGGAGIELDLKVATRWGVHGAALQTCRTLQTARGMQSLELVPVSGEIPRLRLLLRDAPVLAMKLGLLPDTEWIEALSRELPEELPILLDPVRGPTHGACAFPPGRLPALRKHLVPRCELLTPNLPEAAALLGESEADVAADGRGAALRLLELGPRSVLLKGGHGNDPEWSVDTWAARTPGGNLESMQWSTRRHPGPAPRGTGCALGSAIVSAWCLGLRGARSVVAARDFLSPCIGAATRIGAGAPYLDLWAGSPGQESTQTAPE